MTKKVQVLVLSTENKTHLLRNTYKFTPEHGNPWEYRSQILEDAPNRGYEFNHLYFTIKEEIGEDKYCYNYRRNTIEFTRIMKDTCEWAFCNKIVATTNPDLWKSVAKIPTDFLEAYIREQGKITEVLLEYDKFMCNPSDPKSEGMGEGYMLGRGYVEHGYYTELKLRPNGTVIIHPVKQKTYTREEVRAMLSEYGADVASGFLFNKDNTPAVDAWLAKYYPE